MCVSAPILHKLLAQEITTLPLTLCRHNALVRVYDWMIEFCKLHKLHPTHGFWIRGNGVDVYMKLVRHAL
jgi:hypothetical protein